MTDLSTPSPAPHPDRSGMGEVDTEGEQRRTGGGHGGGVEKDRRGSRGGLEEDIVGDLRSMEEDTGDSQGQLVWRWGPFEKHQSPCIDLNKTADSHGKKRRRSGCQLLY